MDYREIDKKVSVSKESVKKLVDNSLEFLDKIDIGCILNRAGRCSLDTKCICKAAHELRKEIEG